MTEEQRAAFEERAAIIEYDGGLPRAEAERLARLIVLGVPKPEPGALFVAVQCTLGHSGMIPVGSPLPAYCGRCGEWNVRRSTP